MPLNLTTPTTINGTVSTIKINSFAVDVDKKEMYVAYSEMNGLTVLAEKSITIVEPDFTKAISEAGTIAGTDIYLPLKTALYNQIQSLTTVSGTVV